MTDKESAKISKAVRALNIIFDADSNELDTRVKLDPGTRKFIDEARVGLKDTLATHLERAENKVMNLEYLIESSDDLNIQLEFFDEKGKPRNLDENGKPKPVERRNDIDKADGEQLELPEVQEDPSIQPWKIPTGVPLNIDHGLRQALLDGAGQTKAINAVVQASGGKSTKVEVRAYWDKLLNAGLIYKADDGKWTAVPIDENPVECNSEDPAVLATSETPEQGLVQTVPSTDSAVFLRQSILEDLQNTTVDDADSFLRSLVAVFGYEMSEILAAWNSLVSDGLVYQHGKYWRVTETAAAA